MKSMFRTPVEHQHKRENATSHNPQHWQLSPAAASSANDSAADADCGCTSAFQTTSSPADDINTGPAPVALVPATSSQHLAEGRGQGQQDDDLTRLEKASKKLIEERRLRYYNARGKLVLKSKSRRTRVGKAYIEKQNEKTLQETALLRQVDAMMRVGGLDSESPSFALALFIQRTINAIADAKLRALLMNADSLDSQQQAWIAHYRQQLIPWLRNLGFLPSQQHVHDPDPRAGRTRSDAIQIAPWLREVLEEQGAKAQKEEEEEALKDFYNILPACRRLVELFPEQAQRVPAVWQSGVHNLYREEWEESWDLQQRRKKSVARDPLLVLQEHQSDGLRSRQAAFISAGEAADRSFTTTSEQAGTQDEIQVDHFCPPTSGSSSSVRVVQPQVHSQHSQSKSSSVGSFPSSGSCSLKNHDPNDETSKDLDSTLSSTAARQIRNQINEVADPKLRLVLMSQDLIGLNSHHYNIAAKGILVDTVRRWKLVNPDSMRGGESGNGYQWDAWYVPGRYRLEANKWMKTHGVDPASNGGAAHAEFLHLLPAARRLDSSSSTSFTTGRHNNQAEKSSWNNNSTQQRTQLQEENAAEQWASSLELEQLLSAALAADVAPSSSQGNYVVGDQHYGSPCDHPWSNMSSTTSANTSATPSASTISATAVPKNVNDIDSTFLQALQLRKQINEVPDWKLKMILMTLDLMGPASNFYSIAAKEILVNKVQAWNLTHDGLERRPEANAYQWDTWFIANSLRREASKWLKKHGYYDAATSTAVHENFLRLLPTARALHNCDSSFSLSFSADVASQSQCSVAKIQTTLLHELHLDEQWAATGSAEQWAASLELQQLLGEALGQEEVGVVQQPCQGDESSDSSYCGATSWRSAAGTATARTAGAPEAAATTTADHRYYTTPGPTQSWFFSSGDTSWCDSGRGNLQMAPSSTTWAPRAPSRTTKDTTAALRSDSRNKNTAPASGTANKTLAFGKNHYSPKEDEQDLQSYRYNGMSHQNYCNHEGENLLPEQKQLQQPEVARPSASTSSEPIQLSDWKSKQRKKYKIKIADAFVEQDMEKAQRFAQLLADLDGDDVDETD
ncbi:unnamed protein product [Amoebophrya sp. A120]|nr:unnamed protein product [Amoebophrya sp. A120]|eukprot:GSA120T00006862001.1